MFRRAIVVLVVALGVGAAPGAAIAADQSQLDLAIVLGELAYQKQRSEQQMSDNEEANRFVP